MAVEIKITGGTLSDVIGTLSDVMEQLRAYPFAPSNANEGAPVSMPALTLAPSVEPEKPAATTRNTKAEKDKPEEPKAETPEPVKVETPEEPKEEGPSKDDLKAALSELIASGKEDGVRLILEKHGAERISALKPSQYDAVIADAKAVV